MILSDDINKKIMNNKNLPMEFKYNDKIMYIKKDHLDNGLNELLGKKLADIFDIKCANYYLYETNNKKFIISEGINNNGQFYLYDSFCGLCNNSLYEIWNAIEKYFNNTRILMEDLIKVYIYDMLFCNHDRNKHNWGILQKEDNNELYIFDNSFLFMYYFKPILTCNSSNNEYLKNYRKYLKNINIETSVFSELSSLEDKEKCIELLNLIDDKKLDELINEVEIIAGRKYISRPNLERFNEIKNIMLNNLQKKVHVYTKK